MSASLIDQVRRLLDTALQVFEDPSVRESILAAQRRLDEPLRVAIAGRVKAGKSTLLNALVRERLAPTDTSECTRIVTWYRDGLTYRVTGHLRDEATPVSLRFRRDDAHIDIDLAGRDPAEFESLDVEWPSPGLRRVTLIDTPGVGSLSADVAQSTFEFLDPDEGDSAADAVVYLMKHVHRSDLDLLESFHDTSMALPNAVNAIAVLSRADEIGAGRLDAMGSARRIAQRYADDPKIRRLVQVVVPVAGLLAETAATLTETEFRQLQTLSGVDRAAMDLHLLSVDRFIEADPATPFTSIERSALVGRLGLYGIRVALTVLRRRPEMTSRGLAEELRRRSGIVDLHELLETLFLQRTEVLKARTALLTVERLCAEAGAINGVAELAGAVEEVTSAAHPFNELATLAALRSGWIEARPTVTADLERTLGVGGVQASARLGLEASEPATIRSEAFSQVARWQRLAENPLTSRDLAVAIGVAIRSLEGIIANLADDDASKQSHGAS